jgi:signal transduction histidine kinase
LYVGTWGGGLLIKKGDRFESEGELDRIPSAVVSLYEGRDGGIWVGTTSGLFRYESGKVTWSAGKEKLDLPNVRAITEGPDGTLWFGMLGGGLGSLKGTALQQFKKRDGLSSDFVQCLYADPDGTLWIGTADNGLARWKDGRFSSIRPHQGLPTSIISHLVDDGAGNLWLGTHSGILRASKANLNRCANGETPSIHCLSYGRAEGLTAESCSGGFQPGACRAADGLLWFPTVKGLAIVDPLNATTNQVEPPVVIEELLVEGKRVDRPAASIENDQAQGGILKISPGKQRFEIRYTGLSFAAPHKVLFKYKLEGLEREWVEAGTRRVAEYSYLPPGTYNFRVIACNNDEVWNSTGASLAFTVLPWFWQTWWFRAGAIVSAAAALGMSVVSVTRRRVRTRLEQLERQRAVERERARIARDIHDDLGASLTRITMLSQSIRSELGDTPQAASDVDEIYGTARELTRAMDEIVWAVNPQHDSVDSLVTYLGRFAQNFLSNSGIRCRIDVPLHLPGWTLTAEIRHNAFLAFKEALHNVVKHARASEVRISLEVLPHGFVLLIVDNGCGFDVNGFKEPVVASLDSRLSPGNGLFNMRKRLEEIGGRCEWDTAPGEGTRVKLVIAVNP